jgi:signal transduction histidine kinase
MSDPDRLFASTSPEFVALCQTQIALLTQGFGAAWTALYLTEESTENSETKLIPLVLYPQNAKIWEKNEPLALPEVLEKIESKPSFLLEGKSESQEIRASKSETPSLSQKSRKDNLSGLWQIVLPLIYDSVMMGLLVTGRKDRHWNEGEIAQVEKIARTLAIGRLLDQRQQWYQHQLREQQQLLNRQRNRFDDLLHQLRNPLTALRTFGKLLLKRLLPEDRNQKVVEGILRESDRLQELLQQLEEEINLLPRETPVWQTVELESHSPLLLADSASNIESVEVLQVLEPLLVSAEAIASERGLNFSAEIPSNLPPVKAHTKALREILSNLIDNALKYTPPEGKIIVKAGMTKRSERENFQGIAVCDNGYGIPSSDRERLFERHYRGVQQESDIPGTGLGLAIAKELIEQMQGEIELISPNHLSDSNPGTTFIIWLPEAKQ